VTLRRQCLVAFAASVAAAAVASCTKHDASTKTSVDAHVIQQSTPTNESAILLAAGDSAYFRADYDSALAIYDRASRDAGARNDSTTIARALTNIGLVAWHQGRFADAESIGTQALALKQRLKLREDLPKSFNALGLLAQNRGDLEQALHHFLAAREAAELVHDSGYVAKARGNLGLVYQDLGDFDRARVEFTALRDAAAANGDLRLESNALNNLGMLETRIGNPDEAITWLTKARARYASMKSAVGEENALGQLSVAYTERGEPSRALAYLDSALAVAIKYGLREPEADDLELMAEHYENAGDHRRALELLQRTRAVCDSLKMETKLGHVAFAEAHVYEALGNRRLARARAREAVERQRKTEAHMDELEAELFVAELAQRAGDSAAVAQAIGGARTTTEQLGTATARIKFALGTARIADAARRPRDVLTALDAGQRDTSLLTTEDRADASALRARANFRLEQYAQAADAGRRAVASLERIRQNLAPGTERSSFTADRVGTYADLVITLLTLGQTDEAFRIADAARGRGLVERLGTATRGLPSRGAIRDLAASDSLLRRIDALIGRLRSSDTARSPNSNRAPEPLEGSVSRELTKARHQYEALVDRVARSDPNSALIGAGRVDVAAVRQSLGADEALLEFLSSGDRLVIFVVTRERLRWLNLPFASTELAERVHLARELIASRGSGVDVPLRDLYEHLIAPAENAGMLTGVRSLVIVPHGALTYLPFAALRTPNPGGASQFLVERYSIITVGSASALPALRARPSARLAPPAVVLAPLSRELPFTVAEANAIAHQMAHARVVTGDSATELVLRRALSSAAVVHIATHGAVNIESPMFSSLSLARPMADSDSRSENNGRLETYEVLAMEVRSRLIFLSGCETALGPAWSTSFGRGDDYATLAQAFLFSGAENVVATLWRIDDRGAAGFAREFYKSLATSPSSIALANAQRAFIHNPAFAAPYFWAAYTLSGSGASLSAGR
jgi:CHAT domain-containing protein/tetratricopeptide (TPR) repeat protein